MHVETVRNPYYARKNYNEVDPFPKNYRKHIPNFEFNLVKIIKHEHSTQVVQSWKKDLSLNF